MLLYYPFSFNIPRQGCSLSLLLFALAIESLAVAIRPHPNTHGICCGQQEHKCALFADDVLMYIANPHITLPNLLTLLHQFFQLSGLSLNTKKGHISLHPSAVMTLQSIYNFQWAQTSLPYLGFQLIFDLHSLPG